MPQYQYKIVQPNDDASQAVIEKSGITANFTLAEVAAMQEHNKRQQREIEGQLTIETAKRDNVLRNYPQIADMDPVLLTAIAIYKETTAMMADIEPKLAQVKAAIAENDAMVAQVAADLNLKADETEGSKAE